MAAGPDAVERRFGVANRGAEGAARLEAAALRRVGQVGRPHFARVMVHKGYVKNFQEAFDRYLKKGAAAYEDKFRFAPRDAVSHIAACGGLPVLAHPCTLNCRTDQELESLVAVMLEYGRRGIEAYYPEHTATQIKRYKKIAQKFNLLLTGGSDFHGSMLKGIELGTGRGSLKVGYELLEKMKQLR